MPDNILYKCTYLEHTMHFILHRHHHDDDRRVQTFRSHVRLPAKMQHRLQALCGYILHSSQLLDAARCTHFVCDHRAQRSSKHVRYSDEKWGRRWSRLEILCVVCAMFCRCSTTTTSTTGTHRAAVAVACLRCAARA